MFFSVFDKPINNAIAITHMMDEKKTALMRNDVIIILECIRKTIKEVIIVMERAGNKNDFIYSE